MSLLIIKIVPLEARSRYNKKWCFLWRRQNYISLQWYQRNIFLSLL